MVRRAPTLLVILGILLALAPALAAAGGSSHAVAAAHRRAAVAAADRLLGEIVVPSGATRVASEPAGSAHQLDHPASVIFLADVADETAFWTTPADPETVIATVQAHLPAGFRSSGQSTGGPMVMTTLAPPHQSRLTPREIAVSAVALAGGTTGVRVDALVAYTAPRPAGQRVPAGARVLEITRSVAGAPPSLDLTVSRRSAVRRIAAAVDALPLAGPPGVAVSCPAMSARPELVTFSFRARAGGPVLARLSEPSDTPSTIDPCAWITFTVRGHHEPALTAGGRLLRVAGAVLGVHLASPS